MAEVLSDQDRSEALLRDQFVGQLAKIDRQEENLLDLVADGDVSGPKVKARLLKLAGQRKKLQEELGDVSDRLDVGTALVAAALRLLERPSELYRQSAPDNQRRLNQAIFEKLYVEVDRVTDDVLAEPFLELVEAQRALKGHSAPQPDHEIRSGLNPKAALLVRALGTSSSKTAMVELRGLEPRASSMPWMRSTT